MISKIGDILLDFDLGLILVQSLVSNSRILFFSEVEKYYVLDFFSLMQCYIWDNCSGILLDICNFASYSRCCL